MRPHGLFSVVDDVYQTGTGGSSYDGRQQVLYWADVMSEIAFVVPSTEMYNKYLADPQGGMFDSISLTLSILVLGLDKQNFLA